jgi:hypothetical protein
MSKNGFSSFEPGVFVDKGFNISGSGGAFGDYDDRTAFSSPPGFAKVVTDFEE